MPIRRTAPQTDMSDLVKCIAEVPPGQQAIRAKCFHPTGTFEQFPKEEIEQSIPQRFEKIVQRYPNRIAVKKGDHEGTYDELNKAANRIAHAILKERGDGSEPVALLFEHGMDVIAAILGVLKAGKFCVALDGSCAPERIEYILDDSQATLLVTNTRGSIVANQLRLSSRQLLNFEALDHSPSVANPGLAISPEAIAYLIYTSGSTGKPKGVVQNHVNLLQEIMAYTNAFHITTEDRMSLLASCGSGQGMMNAFSALLNGAGLFPFDVRAEGVVRLIQYLLRERITLYHSSASLFRYLVQAIDTERFPDLRVIRLASQQVLKEDVESYKQHFSPGCVLVNALSSTETGTFRWYFMNKETSLSEDRVPVGSALEDKDVMVLDDEQHSVRLNDVGEIAVKSRYISPGYWQKPELTFTKFLPDRCGGGARIYLTGDLGKMLPGGLLIHLGRKDHQVKIRGYRVELGEVERVLLAHPQVKEVGVVPWIRGLDEKDLVAYIVARRAPAPTISELRGFLKKKLPDYMMPAAFIFLETL